MTNVMRAAFAVFAAGIFAGLTAVPPWTQSAPAQTPSPSGAKVYFVNLKDGQDVLALSWPTPNCPARRRPRPALKKPFPAVITCYRRRFNHQRPDLRLKGESDEIQRCHSGCRDHSNRWEQCLCR